MIAIPSEAEILIVGAGPTGLTLSAELRRRGFGAVTVDKIAAGANTSRAAVVHARTLEVLEPLGVVAQMLEEGVKVPIFRVRDRDRTIITIDFREIPSKYAFTLMCPQDRTEAILLARLQVLGGEVLRPAEVAALEVTEKGARADIEVNGSTQQVAARWLIGCDGMHSRVREAAGIAFKGAAYEQSFVLADVQMDWPFSRAEVSLFFSPAGFVLVAPLPKNRYRIVAAVDKAPTEPSLPYVQAAHVHSPAGGQGMNTGIQDAVALAAVLADVLRGDDDARLDEWAEDRHKIAEDTVTMTDRLMRLATLHSPLGRELRNVAIRFAGHVPLLGRALARKIAELDRR